MGKAVAIAVGGGLASAACFLSAVTGSAVALVLAYLAALPLLLVGLSMGTPLAAIGAAVGTAGVGLAAGLLAALGYAAGTAVPAALAVGRALSSRANAGGRPEWAPPGAVLVALIGYGLAVYAAIVVAAARAGTSLPTLLAERLGPGLPPPMAEMVDLYARFIPGTALSSWVLMLLANLVLAQWILSRRGQALRPTPRLADLELPDWTAGAFALALVAAVLSSSLLGDLAATAALVLGVAYFLVGLAVVHAATRGRPRRGLMLAAFYVVLLLFGWAAFLVAGLGVVDQWAGLRRRLSASPGGAGPDPKE